MAWLAPCGMLCFPMAVYFGILDKSNSAFLHFLYQHSYLPSIQIHIQVTLSSQFPCGCCSAGSICASATKKLLFFVCLLWLHYLSWPTAVWWANIFNVLCHVLFFVQPTLYETCLEVLQVCISGCWLLYILHWCTKWQVHFCVDSVDLMLRLHISHSLFSSWFWQ